MKDIMSFAKSTNTTKILNPASVRDYFENTNIMSKSTAEKYRSRLKIFNAFLYIEYDGLTIEAI
jgi:hypothetical protein